MAVSLGIARDTPTPLRVLPSHVHWSTLEHFQDQIRLDLPPGTPKEEVEAYLTRWNILHTFIGPNSILPSESNVFYARVRSIGRAMIIFSADLQIRVYFDEREKVREIVFRLDYK